MSISGEVEQKNMSKDKKSSVFKFTAAQQPANKQIPANYSFKGKTYMLYNEINYTTVISIVSKYTVKLVLNISNKMV